MTDLDVRPDPAPPAPDDGDELHHYVCCRERDRAFCGSPGIVDHTGTPAGARPVTCVVCIDVHDAHPGICPFTHHPCPPTPGVTRHTFT